MSDPRGYDDELISAYLDGEIGLDEAARIERDPQARARAAELATAQDAVAEPVPPLAAAERDRLRAAAVAAAPPAAPVRPISAASQRRSRAFIPLVAAAGIAAVVLGAMAVLRNLDDDRGDSADWSTASAPATVQSASDDSAGDMAAADIAVEDMAMAEEAEMAAESESGDPAFDDDMAETAAADGAGAPAAEDPVEEVMTTDEAAAEMPAATTAEPTPAPESADTGQGEPGPTDLGSFASLEQLIDRLALRTADGDDFTDPFTEPGLCAETVAERVAELSAEIVGEARAELEDSAGADPSGAVDLTVVTIGDERPAVVYAVAPGCTVEVASLK